MGIRKRDARGAARLIGQWTHFAKNRSGPKHREGVWRLIRTIDLYLHFARDQQVHRGASVSLPEQCFPALEVDCAERFEKPFARTLERISAHRHREIGYAPERAETGTNLDLDILKVASHERQKIGFRSAKQVELDFSSVSARHRAAPRWAASLNLVRDVVLMIGFI